MLRILLVFVGLLATGCVGPAGRQAPMADSTVVQVLLELHLLEARSETDGDVPPAARDSVFAHYGVSEELFEKTLAYYAGQPEAFGQIYGRLLDRINVERLEVSGL